jgi:hypothetical protein
LCEHANNAGIGEQTPEELIQKRKIKTRTLRKEHEGGGTRLIDTRGYRGDGVADRA